MIEDARGNLLQADAEALVNTVNTVGDMGKGIALQFKQALAGNFDIHGDRMAPVGVVGVGLEAHRCYRLAADVVGRKDLVPQRAAALGVQHLLDALVVLVTLRHEGQDEARVEKDHRGGFPYT